MPDLWENECAAWAQGYETVCGVDEAGAGPLMGPVYAAAVILPRGCVIDGLNDSKKLTPKKRDALYDVIIAEAEAWAVASVSAAEIDATDILSARMKAMQLAIDALAVRPDFALIDGNRDHGKSAAVTAQHACIIGGDGCSASIAAASILAKVSRDRYVTDVLDPMYPQYGFAKHKGYGTRAGIFHRPGARKVTSELQVLRGVDLTVEKGDVVAILGPSGSGKTTLLRCLNFLETADAGQLTFDGETFDLAQASRADIARLRKKTAFVFQSYNLFRNKTALQNVTEGLIIARKMPKEQADAVGMKMLEKVGLADRADYYPRQLSGGQQQRVAIARALASDPEIIYFDEPTSALDPELTGEVLAVMRQLAEEGMTMLVVTHEMGFARNVSSKTVFMENGVVVEQAPSHEFFANPKEERTREFLRKIAHTE